MAAEVWMRPCVSVSGTRCTRCTPLSNLSLAKTPRPLISGHDLLVPAGGALAFGQDLDPPSLEFGVAGIHAEQIPGEKRRLVATGPRTDLEDRALLVRGILRQQKEAQRLGAAFDVLRACGRSSSARARISASVAGIARSRPRGPRGSRARPDRPGSPPPRDRVRQVRARGRRRFPGRGRHSASP